jgi:hypothetical protein
MRASEFIKESKIPMTQQSATPGMDGHPHLDNSSPYAPWRFAAHFLGGADGKNPYEHEPDKEGPSGQALVTVAYSQADADIINQAERAFGGAARSKQLTPKGSTEPHDTHKTSPMTAFKGFKKSKNKK